MEAGPKADIVKVAEDKETIYLNNKTKQEVSSRLEIKQTWNGELKLT